MLQDERPPLVQFETRPMEDRSQTLENGHYAFKDVDFVLVTPSGGRDTFENEAKVWMEQQQILVRDGRVKPEFYEYYQRAYKSFKDGQGDVIDGTPIKSWPVLSPAQIKTILQANILTVEDLAVCPDESLSRIGMGARAYQNKAKAWLESAKGAGVATGRIVDLESKLQEALNMISKQDQIIERLEKKLDLDDEDEPKKRGRPSKIELNLE